MKRSFCVMSDSLDEHRICNNGHYEKNNSNIKCVFVITAYYNSNIYIMLRLRMHGNTRNTATHPYAFRAWCLSKHHANLAV
jgi:hypothetical protein